MYEVEESFYITLGQELQILWFALKKQQQVLRFAQDDKGNGGWINEMSPRCL